MQTGIPAQPAANVARLAPGFTPSFSLLPFLVAAAATVGWLFLVAWRTRRHRAAIWKSLALPAGGAILGWVLLMTLWLPALDYGRSYAPHMQQIRAAIPPQTACVNIAGLTRAQVAGLQYYTTWKLHPITAATLHPPCEWTVAEPAYWSTLSPEQTQDWVLQRHVARPTDRQDRLLILQRR